VDVQSCCCTEATGCNVRRPQARISAHSELLSLSLSGQYVSSVYQGGWYEHNSMVLSSEMLSLSDESLSGQRVLLAGRGGWYEHNSVVPSPETPSVGDGFLSGEYVL
jgi:hypothetical protein